MLFICLLVNAQLDNLLSLLFWHVYLYLTQSSVNHACVKGRDEVLIKLEENLFIRVFRVATRVASRSPLH